MFEPPSLVALDHDEYSAKYVGTTAAGMQFFATAPFVPATRGRQGRDFVALYLFDKSGDLVDARIEELQPSDTDVAARLEEFVASLGPVSYGRIRFAPFSVERFGVTFGLIPRPPEQKGESWWVEAQPGNFMAFSEPFDSGEYDT